MEGGIMGCDIHVICEVSESNQGSDWRPNRDKVFKNAWYDPNGKFDFNLNEFEAHPSEIRNYNWFGFLADVRNGTGFAGIITGVPLEPIAANRGIGSNPSLEWAERVDDWGGDLHSHTFINAEELIDFDFSKIEKVHRGLIPLDQYKEIRETKENPNMWSGAVSGSTVENITTMDAGKILDGTIDRKEGVNYYVEYSWITKGDEEFSWMIENWIKPLKKLKEKYPRVRLQIAFDN